MNILFIKHFFVGFMVSEILIVPYSVTFPYIYIYIYIYKIQTHTCTKIVNKCTYFYI